MKKKSRHSNMPDVEIKSINEPRPVCVLCGKTIDSIANAISEPDGGYSHFDCVIDKIRNDYNVTEPDVVSYIGQGRFGICSKDSNGNYIIKQRINYEPTDSFLAMKKFVEGTREGSEK